MTKQLLASVLENPKVKGFLDDIEQLDAKVGDGPHALPFQLDATLPVAVISVLDTPVPNAAHLQASARITGIREERAVDIFGTGAAVVPHPDKNLAIFDVRADLKAEVKDGRTFGHATIDFHGSTAGGLTYRHYLPVRTSHRRATAYRNVVLGSRLPNLLDLSERLAIGEAHRMEAKLTAGLGLDVKAGYDFAGQTALDLTKGLAPTFTFDLNASLAASMGLGFSSRMTLVVGRVGQEHDDWTRVRLTRENERRLSFGLTFNLAAHYDLGTSLAQLFEDAVDAVPTPRLVRTAREILTLAADPAALKNRLVGEASAVLEDLVQENILTPLTDDASVQQAIQFAGDVVAFYDGLDGEIQGLWDRLLSKVDLDTGSTQGQAVRDWLGRLKALDSDTAVTDLFGDKNKDLIDAVEALTGHSVDELLLDNRLREALTRVATLAGRAESLIDGTPGRILAQIHTFTQKTGIDDIVARLRDVSSVEALQTTARQRIQQIAERLVGKGLDAISPDDLTHIKAWAERVDKLLSTVDLSDETSEASQLVGKIKQHLEQVKAEYGLSVAFEFERVIRGSAVLDFEIDPKGPHQLVGAISDSLGLLKVDEILQAMIEHARRKDDRGDNKKSPFLLRECVFVSERVRTTGVSALFSLVGLGRNLSAKQTGSTQQVEQRRLEVSQDAGTLQRSARYDGGLIRVDTSPEMTASTAVWLHVAEDAASLDADAGLAAPFDGQRSAYLRMVLTTEDSTASARDLEGLDLVLRDLGFVADDPKKGPPSSLAPVGAVTRFACELRAPIDLDTDDWLQVIGAAKPSTLDVAFLDATCRWLDDCLVTNPPEIAGISLGTIVSEALDQPRMVELLRSSGSLQGATNPPRSIGIDGQKIPISLDPRHADPVGARLIGIARQRGILDRQVERIAEAWDEALGQRTEDAYRALINTFARRMRRMWLRGWWPSPAWGLWFWVAAINEISPDTLPQVRGLASFRWLPPGTDPEPQTWQSATYALPTEGDHQGLRDNRHILFHHTT